MNTQNTNGQGAETRSGPATGSPPAEHFTSRDGRQGACPNGSTVAVFPGAFGDGSTGYAVEMKHGTTGLVTRFSLSQQAALLLTGLLIEATDFFAANPAAEDEAENEVAE